VPALVEVVRRPVVGRWRCGGRASDAGSRPATEGGQGQDRRARHRMTCGAREGHNASDQLVLTAATPSMASEIGRATLRHLALVALSLAASVLFGVPLGIVAARYVM